MDLYALLAAAVVSFVIGRIWYSRFLFGTAWARLSGGSMNAAGWLGLLLGFLAEVARAYVMSIVVASMGAFSTATGLEAGFWVWLGFVATVGVGQVLYERRSWKLSAITYGYHLVALLVMGAILANW